jgi:hypothetical protein
MIKLSQVHRCLTLLKRGSTYIYRVVATNVDGTSYGTEMTFTTTAFANAFVTPRRPWHLSRSQRSYFPWVPRTRAPQRH